MHQRVFSVLAPVVIIAGLSHLLMAQEAVPVSPAKPAPPAAAKPVLAQPPAAVKVDIVLSRTNGNKTLSSLPYSLYAAEGRRTSLRLGSQVPIPMAGASVANSPVHYQDVGSNIDCDVMLLSDGRYRLGLTMDDSSLAEGAPPEKLAAAPIIRSYRIETLLVLRSGEATIFNVSTDKVSGDTIRAQVTVTALK